MPTAKTLPNFILSEGVFTVNDIEFSVIKALGFTILTPLVDLFP